MAPEQLTNLLAQVDEYDTALRGHIDRVADLSVHTARAMGLSGEALREVMLAGQLHDIGKLFVAREILDKPGRLDPAELAQMQEHSALGEKLVRRVPELAGAAAAVGQHHEKWDGAGYPNGLRGAEIRLSARIIAACDVFDALVTERPYKAAWTTEQALAELQRGTNSHFDPDVVVALIGVLRAEEPLSRAA